MNLANASNITIGSTSVSAVYLGNTLIWPSTPPHDYSQDYLTITSLANNNDIGWREFRDGQYEAVRTISISTDGGATWTTKTSSTNGTRLAILNNGVQMLIKGENNNYYSSMTHNAFTSTKAFTVSGNILSLIYGDNFANKTLSGSNVSLFNIFNGSTYLTSAEHLILPNMTSNSTSTCYGNLFRNCTSLVTPPTTLPATTLGVSCYGAMFYGCTSLIKAPTLPATTLSQGCYNNMFYGCTSLIKAPDLNASRILRESYRGMFNGCSSLNYVKCLATYSVDTYDTYEWLNGVAASGTFVKDSSNSSWTTGTSGIPTGWTVQTV